MFYYDKGRLTFVPIPIHNLKRGETYGVLECMPEQHFYSGKFVRSITLDDDRSPALAYMTKYGVERYVPFLHDTMFLTLQSKIPSIHRTMQMRALDTIFKTRIDENFVYPNYL